jgi:hypothetical protein
MLKQPMVEKLAAMRFLGMVESLKAQETRPDGSRAELLGTVGFAGRSTVELA